MKPKIVAGCLGLLVGALIFISFGCGALNTIAQNILGGGRDYYPNTDGHSWTYRRVMTSNTTTDAVTLTATITFNGTATIGSITVQKLKTETIFGTNIFTNEAYQVVTDTDVKNYGDQSHPTTEASTYLVFPLLVDNTWTISGNNTAIVEDSESVTVPAGAFSDCIRVHMDFPPDSTTDIWLAKNVGMVKSEAINTSGSVTFVTSMELTSKSF